MIYITKGDVREPLGDAENKIIVHCTNSVGVMGAGVALALLTKWPQVRTQYIEWFKSPTKKLTYHNDNRPELGNVQFVLVETNIWVGNIIGQKDVITQNINNIKIPPVRYFAIYEGLLKTLEFAKEQNASVHAPLLGCELAGGNLQTIYMIINNIFNTSEVDFYLYAFSDKYWFDLQKVARDSGLPFQILELQETK